VTRSLVTVREATPDDVPDLLAMWAELRALGSRYERTAPAPSEDGVRARLRDAQTTPDLRIIVACAGPAVVGMAVLVHQPFAALVEARAVHVNYLHVREGARRQGVGHALVAAAAAFAEEVGAEHVLSSVYPHLRDSQRFYARLGFGPMMVHRAVPLSILRRRLAGSGPGQIDGVLARRRSTRLSRRRVGQQTITST
jgi:GNAT superfamily N-acetyltransferase